ncbi:MAG: alpha/beta hydrolase [Legionella sp.]|nr:alpha/beta hydrolase [Legionella sp.]
MMEKKMPVNKAEQKFFELLSRRKQKNPSKPLDKMTVDEFRASSSLFLEFGGETENIVMENVSILSRDGSEIPIRVFNSNITTAGPILIMYPGGGYVMDTFEANAIACSRIAKYSGMKVILINYRLAPENPLPISIFDALDATIYISTHADQFKLDPTKMFIGGFSAGAHCAAVISTITQADVHPKIYHQILLNGAYDATLNKRDYAEYESQDLMVSREGTGYIYRLWNLTETDIRSPMYSPYYATNTGKLPKTSIVVAEFDGMRSDSELYYQKLKTNGCQVSKIVLPGQCHHTIILRGAITDGEDPAKVIAKIFMRES